MVHLLNVEQITYDEYITRMPNPTVMNLLSVEPLPGVGILEIPLGCAMVMVDHLLGGHGGDAQPERPLSEIEMALLRGLLQRGLGELRYAFEGVVPLEPAIVNVEYNPQFAQAAMPSEMVLVCTFEQKIGEYESTLIALPAVQPDLRPAGDGGRPGGHQRARAAGPDGGPRPP